MHPMITASLASFSNMITLGILIKSCAECTYLISLAGFCSVFAILFFFLFSNGFHKPKIPMKNYLMNFVLFFLKRVLNNRSLSYGVSVPLQTVLRSSNLFLNICIGKIFMGRRYCKNKYLAAILVTLGVITITIYDKSFQNNSSANQIVFGLFLIFCSVVLSTILPIVQEDTFSKHGKHVMEYMFYTNVLSILPFVFLYKNIAREYEMFSSKPGIEITGFFGIVANIPLWIILIIYVTGQYFFTKSEYEIISKNGSLTVVVFNAIRRFTNIVLGLYFSGATFHPIQWASTGLVFLGVMIYSGNIRPFKTDV